MHLSISELATKYKQLADAILNAGPLVNDNLADAKIICEAACRIRERTVDHFGLSAGESVELTDEQLQQLLEQPSVRTSNEALGKAVGVSAGDGNKGPFVDMLMQLVQLAMTNPQLLTLILSLFKKPA